MTSSTRNKQLEFRITLFGLYVADFTNTALRYREFENGDTYTQYGNKKTRGAFNWDWADELKVLF